MAEELIGKTIERKYRPIAVLGEGAMGVVYRAEQLDIEGRPQRQVALKTLLPHLSTDPDFSRRFLREVRVAMQLRSPHTVMVYDSGKAETGQLYYTMELIRGPTFREVLRQQGKLSIERAVKIASQICEALGEAHGLPKPVVHRDLKPPNIFIEQNQGQDWVKISDFGIAKVLGEHTSGLTQTNMSPGTPRYMAPEQWTGQAIDGRADLYALGIILYEMLTGRPPFTAEGGPLALMSQHVHTPPPALPATIPADLRVLVGRLLAKMPHERPPDAQSVRRVLEMAVNGEGTASTVHVERGDGRSAAVPSLQAEQGVTVTPSPPSFVGREREVGQLQEWFARALRGQRQVVFVTGEPGVGKTSVVETFLQQIEATGKSWIERGQCVEQYGPGEAYLPILEALGRSCRRAGGERIIDMLRRYAPTWLVQLPAVIPDAEFEVLQRKVQGATRERMLREMAEALEVLSAATGFILVLEDLQWSDPSTLDLVSAVARRREAARLLVIGTYRPAEGLVSGHPLRALTQDLQGRRLSKELALDLLPEAAVSQYLAAQFPQHQFPSALSQFLYRSTEGNPLFLVNAVDHLVAQGLLREVDGHWRQQAVPEDLTFSIPESLRQLIAKQIERLSQEEQRVLEVASVAGADFSALTVAAGVGEGIEQVEARCEGLMRRGQFLRASAMETVPEGTLTGRYSFLHALYQSVLYERIGVPQRVRLHRRIGECLETAYGARAGEIAAELAVHFEQGQHYPRAILYLQQAAQRAIDRSANVEAISHLTKGLELLRTLPDTPERAQQELTLQLPLGVALMTTKGYATLEVARTYARVQELCQQLGETPQLFLALPPLRGFHFVRGELRTAREVAEQYFTLAQRIQAPVLLVWAYYGLGETLLFSGELVSARAHLEQGVASYDPEQVRAFFVRTVQDPGVACLSHIATALWYLGYPDQACERIRQALALAQELSHPFSVAWVLCNLAAHYQLRREEHLAQEQAEAAMRLAQDQGFPFCIAWAETYHGWVLAQQGQGAEGIAQIHRGMAAYRAMGIEVQRPQSLLLLADAYTQAEQGEEGLKVLTEASEVIHKMGVWRFEAEVHRLKGELMLQKFKSQESRRVGIAHQGVSIAEAGTVGGAHPTGEDEAEVCFLKAIDIARKQSAKSLELRATVSLSRLWQEQGKKAEAHQMLAEIYGWFTEGFDTKDLREAKALLQELA